MFCCQIRICLVITSLSISSTSPILLSSCDSDYNIRLFFTGSKGPTILQAFVTPFSVCFLSAHVQWFLLLYLTICWFFHLSCPCCCWSHYLIFLLFLTYLSVLKYHLLFLYDFSYSARLYFCVDIFCVFKFVSGMFKIACCKIFSNYFQVILTSVYFQFWQWCAFSFSLDLHAF
jgi:hypothetical protein